VERRPLLAFSLAFIAGIALGLSVSFDLALASILIAGAGLLRRAGAGGWLLAAFCLMGCLRSYCDLNRSKDDLIALAPRRSIELIGTVISEPEAGTTGSRFILKVTRLLAGSQWADVTGKTYVLSSVAGPDYGDTLWLHGHLEIPLSRRNPGGFDLQGSLNRRGVGTVFRVRFPYDCRLLGDVKAPFWMEWALYSKRRLVTHIRKLFPPLEATVLLGLLFGIRADLPPALKDAFVATGTVHVLATAGLHVGLIALMLERLFWHLTIPPRARAVSLMLSLGLYAVMAGGRPSVARAALMAALYLAALILNREPDIKSALGMAATILLAIRPRTLFEPGFQLSFVCVTAILLITPLLERRMQPLTRWLDRGRGHPEPAARLFSAHIARNLTACTAVSAAAQIGVWPLVAYYDHLISPVSVLANLIIVPPMALILGLGMLAALGGALGLPFAPALAFITRPLLTCLIGAVLCLSQLPFAWLSIPSPPIWAIVLYYLLVGGIIALSHPHQAHPEPLHQA